jgi:type IV fimbrial biogenesis protein FimT
VVALQVGHRRARCGFTVVEVVCALAIAGIALATVAPRIGAMRAALQLRQACVQLQSAIVRARIGALSEDRSWELRVEGTGGYRVGPVAGPALFEALPAGVFFSRTTSGGTVRFSPLGIAENATFDLTIGASTRQVVVNQRGKVSIE